MIRSWVVSRYIHDKAGFNETKTLVYARDDLSGSLKANEGRRMRKPMQNMLTQSSLGSTEWASGISFEKTREEGVVSSPDDAHGSSIHILTGTQLLFGTHHLHWP
jgi:hypothetical protein